MSRNVAGGVAWEFPVRAFHWALAVLVVFSFITGKIGGPWLEWHMRSGYAILTLVLYRIAWGFAGDNAARFSSFLRGPRAAFEYIRGLRPGSAFQAGRHNPLGGWMVAAMIAILLLQAASGLFTNDESSHEGPLAQLVSNAMVDRLSVVHAWNQWLVVGAVSLHVTAIVVYQWHFRQNLTRAMVRGPVRVPLVAAVLLAIAAAIVYTLVVIVPRSAQ